MLTANLEASSARLDGRSVPLGAFVPASCGSHRVEFHNQTLGERLDTQVELAPGVPRRVVADFRSAKAHVRVQ
jgi:hypothetical protein